MSARPRKEGGTSNPVPVGSAKAVRSFQGAATSEGPQICPTNGIAAEAGSFGAGVISSSVLEPVLQCAAICLVYCRLAELPGSSFTGLYLHSVWFRNEHYRCHRWVEHPSQGPASTSVTVRWGFSKPSAYFCALLCQRNGVFSRHLSEAPSWSNAAFPSGSPAMVRGHARRCWAAGGCLATHTDLLAALSVQPCVVRGLHPLRGPGSVDRGFCQHEGVEG